MSCMSDDVDECSTIYGPGCPYMQNKALHRVVQNACVAYYVRFLTIGCSVVSCYRMFHVASIDQ